ncbi:MAG TPA: gephyrin-like molybdotransferase Glp [Alphaproteobacteria bacterium]|nr:gephyrin-like molybdotransferase Glp [Alphaproteobacteria bacterium]
MIPVEEARERILSALTETPVEIVGLADAHGRVLAEDVVARVTQPPADMSAMDGYAVRAADVATVPASLTCIGEAPAGRAYSGSVGPGQAVRIFTGGPVPDGADAIVIQEDTKRDGDAVTVLESAPAGRYIRPAGLDFRTGAVGLGAGRALNARDIGLAAAMNVPWLSVRRRPRVALLATGNEIVRPGEPLGPDQIVSSNTLAMAAVVRAAGGESVDLGIARDDADSLRRTVAGLRGCDLLITLGGASVGEHDLVRQALGDEGLALDFWQIAMRPGKPLMFGSIDGVPMLGLPGNPVSSLVCGLIFVRPALRRMLGLPRDDALLASAILGRDLPQNDRREDYMRARLERNADGGWTATPFDKQDSSMLSALAQAGCLVVRAPNAAPAKAGAPVPIIRLADGFRGF